VCVGGNGGAPKWGAGACWEKGRLCVWGGVLGGKSVCWGMLRLLNVAPKPYPLASGGVCIINQLVIT
jgi:hypothetical protein